MEVAVLSVPKVTVEINNIEKISKTGYLFPSSPSFFSSSLSLHVIRISFIYILFREAERRKEKEVVITLERLKGGGNGIEETEKEEEDEG